MRQRLFSVLIVVLWTAVIVPLALIGDPCTC